MARHVAVATAVTTERRTRLLEDVRREFEELIGLAESALGAERSQ